MAGTIDSKLFAALQKKLGISRSRLYSRIGYISTARFLDRHLAALFLAAEVGLPIARYATPDQIRELRSGRGDAPAQAHPLAAPTPIEPRSRKARAVAAKKKTNSGKVVFVVHGRNEKLRRAMFSFLRAVGLEPLEWEKALALTKKGAPYVGEVLDRAFEKAVATIVLLTPDDEARLKPALLKTNDGPDERELTGQARANVLFEAGMAFGRHQNRTILVQVGRLRSFSDVGGRHVVHLSNDSTARQAFLNRLEIVGCEINQKGTDWHHEGDFTP